VLWLAFLLAKFSGIVISGLWTCVEELALPKSVERGKLSLNKRSSSGRCRLKSGIFHERIRGHEQMAVLDERFYGWEVRTK